MFSTGNTYKSQKAYTFHTFRTGNTYKSQKAYTFLMIITDNIYKLVRSTPPDTWGKLAPRTVLELDCSGSPFRLVPRNGRPP